MRAADVIVIPTWDGVHVWVDTFDPTRSTDRAVDVRFTFASGETQEFSAVTLPAALGPAQVYDIGIQWRPAEDKEADWLRAKVACVAPVYAAVFDVDDDYVSRRLAPPVEVDQTLIARIGAHVAAWRVTSIVRPHPFRCLAVAESPGPRHVIRTVGEARCQVRPPNRSEATLTSAAVPDAPYQIVGPALNLHLTTPERTAPLYVSVSPRRPGRVITTET